MFWSVDFDAWWLPRTVCFVKAQAWLSIFGGGAGGGGVQGGGGAEQPCWLGDCLPIWPPAAGWLSGRSLTQMFTQRPGQALAGSQTSE